jgi:hypothetical protein
MKELEPHKLTLRKRSDNNHCARIARACHAVDVARIGQEDSLV